MRRGEVWNLSRVFGSFVRNDGFMVFENLDIKA